MTSKRDAAGRNRGPRVAPAGDDALAPGLYLVATPIGNLRDISLRALDTLAGADAVACEDTRVTGKLLSHYGISVTMTPYHDHNAAKALPKLLALLGDGRRVALVSDAGMPLVSDPGYRLVRAAAEAGHPVTSVPGPSAALAGLQLAGLPTDRFLFAGFLPSKSGARRKALQELAAVPATLVFFEGASRLAGSLQDMAAVLGPRPAAVAREITKLHEEVRRDLLPALAAHYTEAGPPKGEVVVVVGPPQETAVDDDEVSALLRAALESQTVRDAATSVAEATGRPRREVYRLALSLAGDLG